MDKHLQVDYWPAIEWICENCGENNFSSMVTPEMSPEEEQESKKALGIEAWENGDLLWAPESVICKFCEEEFKLNKEEH